MPNWPMAFVIGMVVLLLALAWLWLLHRPHSETREGLKALGAMSWRDFSGAVLASFTRQAAMKRAVRSLRSGGVR